MAHGIFIRAATMEDLPEVRRLEEQWAANGETIGFGAMGVELLAKFVGGCFFVAAEEDGVVGFVHGQDKRNEENMSAVFTEGEWYLEIVDLYVEPRCRSMGVGGQLIDAAVAWAKRHGIHYISAFSSTRDVDRVLRFYRSCGFQSWGVQLFRELGEGR